MQSAVEHWRKSAEAKLAQLLEQVDLLIGHWSQKDNPISAQNVAPAAERVSALAGGLVDHYGPGHIPPPLREFRHSFKKWREYPAQPDIVREFFSKVEQLKGITRYKSDEEPSFDAEYEAQKEDKELGESVEALIKRLEELLADADAEISGKAERDLERILAHLRR